MPDGIASYNTEDAHTVFLQGSAAFGLGTGGLIGRIMRENPDMFDKVGILEVLEGPAGPERKLAAGFYQGMFVWKYSPNIPAAKTFIRWFTEPGRLEPVYKASPGTHWPIYKSGIESDRVKTNRLLREALQNVVALHHRLRVPGHRRAGDGHHRRREDVRRPGQPGRRRARRRRSRRSTTPRRRWRKSSRASEPARSSAFASMTCWRTLQRPIRLVIHDVEAAARALRLLSHPAVRDPDHAAQRRAARGRRHRQPSEAEHDQAESDGLRRVQALSPRAVRRGYSLGEPRPDARLDRRIGRRRLCRRRWRLPFSSTGTSGAAASSARSSSCRGSFPTSPPRCIWKWLYADQYGVINNLLARIRTDRQADPVARQSRHGDGFGDHGADLEAHAGHVHRAPRSAAERAEGAARGGRARRRGSDAALPLRHLSRDPSDQRHHHAARLDLDFPVLRHRLPADWRRAGRRHRNPVDAHLPEGVLGLRYRLRLGARHADARLSDDPERRLSLRLSRAEREG